jgi:hypothetical protein
MVTKKQVPQSIILVQGCLSVNPEMGIQANKNRTLPSLSSAARNPCMTNPYVNKQKLAAIVKRYKCCNEFLSQTLRDFE